MKTPSKKSIAVLAAIGCLFFLSSYTLSPESAPEENTIVMDDYSQVYSFMEEKIFRPLYDSLKVRPGKGPGKEFSRCPSGYDPEFTTAEDSIKADGIVSGKLVYYRGCNPNYVCHFKVCVSKNYAALKSPGGNYISVSAWIKRRNAQASQVKAKSVKG